MSIFICSTTYRGCGHVGQSTEWRNVAIGIDIFECPKCFEDHMFQLTSENFESLTDDSNREEAARMMAA